ncbi:MAG: hypothetical protein DMG30_18510 [Acidobacteria bacterium]|nr:MAG: hypothetical protein DMG30_18510 [Acidobacteriota bacterium]
MGAILGLVPRSGNHRNCLQQDGSVATIDSASLEPTASDAAGDAEEYHWPTTIAAPEQQDEGTGMSRGGWNDRRGR